jgi:triacylglycerol lipase
MPDFDQSVSEYSVSTAYWMARTAKLAYSSRPEIESTAREWGFDKVRHFETTFRPPFPLTDTQAFTMAGKSMIVTAFRGTQPAQLRDWLSDVNTPPWPGPAGNGLVHFGFGQAIEAVYPEVRDAIVDLRDNKQTVWFTGHSLGAALATLAALRLYFEPPEILADGLYTFGGPRVCDRSLAHAHDRAFQARTHRFVNNNDIVPQLPPEPLYTHVEIPHYFDANGKLHDSQPRLAAMASRAKALAADAFAPSSDGFLDHSIDKYIGALKQNVPALAGR